MIFVAVFLTVPDIISGTVPEDVAGLARKVFRSGVFVVFRKASSLCVFALSVLGGEIALGQLLAEKPLSRFLTIREKRFSFDGIDYSRLIDEASRRHGVLSADQVEQLISDNVRFIYYNKLNRNRFLVMPAPHHVVSRIERICEERRHLEAALETARQLEQNGREGREMRKVTQRIGQSARSIQRIFREYFQEYEMSPYYLERPSIEDRQRSATFLSAAGEIYSLLERALERYFFARGPAIVEVGGYRGYSIQTLCESLKVLSQMRLGKGPR